MKKLLLLFGLVIATSSCNNPDPTVNSDDDTEYRIEVIDGCEYIYRKSGYSGYMAHKGNCSNPYHKK